MKILITGASGWTASAIIEALHAAKHILYGFDITDKFSNQETRDYLVDHFVGDVADWNRVYDAAEGMEALIHLAVAVGDGDYRSPDIPFRINVRGTYNLFEAACQHDVNRIILLSSAPVHLLDHEQLPATVPADHPLPTSPDNDHLYDLTKHLQETIARDYATTFDMKVVTLRAGHIVDSHTHLTPHNQPLADVQYCRGGWVCRYDVAVAVVQALKLKDPGYRAFNVISDSRARHRFELAKTEKDLGMRFSADFSTYC